MGQFTIVIVTGMHRSGTSLTAETLHKAGLPMGAQFLPGDSYNPRGYFEDVEIVRLHDRLLDSFGRPWGAADHMRPLPEGWLDSTAAGEVADELAAYLADQMTRHATTGAWALKDPRASLFLPLWERVAERLGAGLKMVLCLRNAAAVAASLKRRDSMPGAVARLLWLGYNANAIAHAPKSTTLVFYSDWQDAPAETAARLTKFIGLGGVALSSEFYEPAYTTAAPAPSEGLIGQWDAALDAAGKSHRLTAALRKLAEDYLAHARALDAVPSVLSEGSDAAEANRGLSRDLSNYRNAYETLSQTHEIQRTELESQRRAREALEAELAVLKDEAGGALAASAEARAEAEALQQDLLDHEAALSESRRQLAALEAERDEQAAAAARYQAAYQEMDHTHAAARAEITRLEAERDELVKVADSHLQAYRVLEERIVARDAALAALTESQAGTQARITELQDRADHAQTAATEARGALEEALNTATQAKVEAETGAQAKLDEERRARLAIEAQLQGERRARTEAETAAAERVEEARKQRAGLEESLSAERQARAGLEDTLALERRARTTAETALAAQVEEARVQRAALETELSGERAARTEAEATRAGLVEQLDGAEALRDVLEGSLGELQKSLATLQSALEEERDTAVRLHEKLEAERGNSTRMKAELDAAGRAFAEMEQRAADNIAAYHDIDARLAGALRDLEKVTAERDDQGATATRNLEAYQEIDARLAGALDDLERLARERDEQGAARRASEAQLEEARRQIDRLRKWHLPSRLSIGAWGRKSETGS